jgi:mannose-6-phosphate isomerase-like protein (cupin superfamily)
MKIFNHVSIETITLTIIASIFINGACIAADDYYLPKTGEAFSYKDITPEIWDATEQNMKSDPMDSMYSAMRASRQKALKNPDAPQMFSGENLIQNEYSSSKNPWQKLEDVINIDWKTVNIESPKELAQLRKSLKVKTVFNHPDLKIIEVAIGSGALLPRHADSAPGAYHIVEGSAEITVNGETIHAFTGTSVKLESLSERRIQVTSGVPLKLLWFRWAPGGEQAYLDYGYYLTGSNFHLQPLESVMPKNYQQWEERFRKRFLEMNPALIHEPKAGFFDTQQHQLATMKNKDKFKKIANQYPTAPQFSNELDVTWLDFENMPSEGFFWAKDASQGGDALASWNKMTRMKGVFQAKVPNKQFDFNISYIASGPTGKYVTHSHATPEFYYILGGKTEWIISGTTYVAVPGNVYFHNPYAGHEMRGLEEGNPEIVITGSWAPFGDRTVFKAPTLLTEALVQQPENSVIKEDFNFHDFKIMKNLKFQKK